MLPQRSHGSLHLPRPFEHYDSSSSRCLPHLSVWQLSVAPDFNPLQRGPGDSSFLRCCVWKGTRGTFRFLRSLSITYLTNLFQQWRVENGRTRKPRPSRIPPNCSLRVPFLTKEKLRNTRGLYLGQLPTFPLVNGPLNLRPIFQAHARFICQSETPECLPLSFESAFSYSIRTPDKKFGINLSPITIFSPQV